MIEIKLSEVEMLQAAMQGITRQISNLRKGRKDFYGCPANVGWQVHVEGCCGELAVAKCLNIYWNGNFEKMKADDVGKFQIRTADSHNKRLILHPDDPDDRAFILVTGTAPNYRIQGWIYARDGKKKENWSDPSRKGRPAFFVGREDLNPMDTLPGR